MQTATSDLTVPDGMLVHPFGPEQVDDRRQRRVLAYWNEKRGDRFAPSRADIDPADLPRLLASLYLYKVRPDPLDYEVVLVGTHLVDVLGRDFTGELVSDIFSDPAFQERKKAYDEVVRTGIPNYGIEDAGWIQKDYFSYSRLILPLSDDGKTVDRLFGCVLFK